MNYRENYEKWLNSKALSEEEKKELKKLSENEIEDSFRRELEFGTGGLRAVMGLGTNRLNVYTVRQATEGLARFINSNGKEAKERGVVIAYDSRLNSALFAKEAAKVISANGIRAYLFESLRPTPELSFAVRYLNAFSGIVITASHNPKEYNGYKVYGEDGGQVPPDSASKILGYINEVDIFDDIKTEEKEPIITIGKEVDNAYIKSVKGESMGVKIPEDFKVLYTPLHGSGNIPVRQILSEIGVKNLYVVESQEAPDGNFPTVKSPNPENREAFDIAIEKAKTIEPDLIFGTDPDSDRIGIAAPDKNGEYVLLTGNQTGALLADFILRKTAEGKMPKSPKIVKTIVTTELTSKIAEEYGAETVDVLTGFKYIGDKIKEYEKTDDTFIFGLEESYGYLKGTYARDKDAVVAAMLICEMAADCKERGISVLEYLEELYKKHGYHRERLINYTFKGISGEEKIKSIMKYFRECYTPSGLISKKDYKDGIDGLPKSDVIKFFLSDGWMAVRPSGTEPKIKFYVAKVASSISECEEKIEKTAKEIDAIVNG